MIENAQFYKSTYDVHHTQICTSAKFYFSINWGSSTSFTWVTFASKTTILVCITRILSKNIKINDFTDIWKRNLITRSFFMVKTISNVNQSKLWLHVLNKIIEKFFTEQVWMIAGHTGSFKGDNSNWLIILVQIKIYKMKPVQLPLQILFCQVVYLNPRSIWKLLLRAAVFIIQTE